MVKMPHWPIPMGYTYKDIDLMHMKRLLQLLGNPHTKLPPTIHITGTNGKGSTLAFLRSIFSNCGYKVHSYSSPHLIQFNERICLSNRTISDQQLHRYIEKCRTVADAHPEIRCSFFEYTTAIAFCAFADIAADILIMEVGLGGIVDATNVVEHSDISVITSISYDHINVLGDSLQSIAKEKVGIIKKESICIVGWQHKEVADIVRDKCNELHTRCLGCGEEWDFFVKDDELYIQFHEKECSDIVKALGKSVFGPYKPSLIGIHQRLNASVAIVTSLILSLYRNHTFAVKKIIDSMPNALSKTKWSGRMERIDSGPLFAALPSPDWELWMDGAHNPAAAEMLAASFANLTPQKPLYIIHGRSADRDIEGFLMHMQQLNPRMLCCVFIKSEPKAENPEKIYKIAKGMSLPSFIYDYASDALAGILADAKANGINEARVLVCGSLYLMGDLY